MNVGSGVNAGEIDCRVLRLVDGLRWLKDFVRDEQPDVTRKIRPWFFILNTDPKNNAELTDSLFMHLCLVAFNYMIHLVFLLASKVCGHYCIFYIYLRSLNYLLNDNVYLLTNTQVVTYRSNSIFTICKFVFEFTIYVTVLVKVQILMSIVLNKLKCK